MAPRRARPGAGGYDPDAAYELVRAVAAAMGVPPPARSEMVACRMSACGDCGSPVILNGTPGGWIHVNGGSRKCDPRNTPGYIPPQPGRGRRT